jgi:hypothetical protein
MTTKKRLVLISALPVIIVVALGVLAMIPPRPGVTKANFDRIEKGMTRAEVERIFGGPATEPNIAVLKDVYRNREQVEAIFGREGQGTEWGRYWKADDGAIAAIWFSDDCVTDTAWEDSDETIPNKIRRWLHLQ